MVHSTLIPSFSDLPHPHAHLCPLLAYYGDWLILSPSHLGDEVHTHNPGLLPGFRSSLERNFSSNNLWIPARETISAALPWARQSRRSPNGHIFHSYWMPPDCNCHKNLIPHAFGRRNNTSIVTPSPLFRSITAPFKVECMQNPVEFPNHQSLS